MITSSDLAPNGGSKGREYEVDFLTGFQIIATQPEPSIIGAHVEDTTVLPRRLVGQGSNARER